MPVERAPIANVVRRGFRAFKMRVVKILDNGFSRVQNVCIGNMVHEQEEIVRGTGGRFVDPADGGAVLPDKSSSGCDRAIHADAAFIGAMPLAPAVPLGSFNGYTVMIAENIGQSLKTERTRVVLVGS